MTPKQKKRLNQFHDEFKAAEARFQMALQTVQGAQADMQEKYLRFHSAVEFVGGAGATWTHNPDDGVVIVEPGKAPQPAQAAQNGAAIAAGATRRQIKKAFKA